MASAFAIMIAHYGDVYYPAKQLGAIAEGRQLQRRKVILGRAGVAAFMVAGWHRLFRQVPMAAALLSTACCRA